LNVTTEVKIEAAKKIEALCKSLDPRIKTIRSAGISETLSEAFLQNHEGNRLTSRSTYFGASISCKAEENGEGQMGGDARFSNFFSTLEVDACAKEAAHTATRLLGAKPLRSGKLPAVIERGIVADLIDFLASSFLGDEMEKGRSMLQGKLGQKLFSEKVTLLDDGLLSKGYSTRRFDAEGSASQTTSLVDQGVFREILLDQTTARRMKMKSTGNSARSVKAPPSIATTNFYLRPGSSTFDELIESAHHGILITDLMGVHTANAITGDFSLGASGILIENGKLTRPVRGFAVAGNILQIFKTVATLGNDLRFYGGTGAPSILTPELAISGE